jgi:hypothetical protein
MKICKTCGKEKDLKEFHKDKYTKDGFMSKCAGCRNEYKKEKYLSNKDSYNSKRRLKYSNDSELRNKLSSDCKKYREKNKDKLSETRMNKYYSNEEYRRYLKEKSLERYHKIIKFDGKARINMSISNGIWYALRDKKAGRHWEELVGYTLEELTNHLESKFKPGMTFDNYGKWHIDHIKPKSSFNYKSYEDDEFKECWALENLQPLWAEENIRKSNKE